MSEAELSEIGSMILRVIFATVLGALVGWERERHDRPAGLRTHMLVSAGAALLTVISISFAQSSGSDPTRIMSNIVTGIGFLGAGTIIRQGSMVHGLTTAASLWVVSAVGMAAGIGGKFYVIAFLATLIMYLTLTVVNKMEQTMLAKRQYRDLLITTEAEARAIDQLMDLLDSLKVVVKSLSREPIDDGGARITRIGLRLPPKVTLDHLTREIARIPDITRFEWD